MVFAELVRHSYVHCAERGLLLERVRARYISFFSAAVENIKTLQCYLLGTFASNFLPPPPPPFFSRLFAGIVVVDDTVDGQHLDDDSSLLAINIIPPPPPFFPVVLRPFLVDGGAEAVRQVESYERQSEMWAAAEALSLENQERQYMTQVRPMCAVVV